MNIDVGPSGPPPRRPTSWPDVAMLAMLCGTVIAVVWLVTR